MSGKSRYVTGVQASHIAGLVTGLVAALDIPAQLRNLADEIERGETPAETVMCLVVHSEDQPPMVYGWGKTGGRFRELGILQGAIAIATQTQAVPA